MSINKAVQYRVWLNTQEDYYTYAARSFNSAVDISHGFANHYGPSNTGVEQMVDDEWVERGKEQ